MKLYRNYILIVIMVFACIFSCSEDDIIGGGGNIDPCPGWPFKVGTVWIYQSAHGADCHNYSWESDSIITYNGKSYVRVIENGNIRAEFKQQQFFFRSDQNRIYKSDGLGEWLQWDYNTVQNEDWWVIRERWNNTRDTLGKMTCVNDSVPFNNEKISCTAKVFGFCTMHDDPECSIELVCKEYGVVGRQDMNNRFRDLIDMLGNMYTK